MTHSSVDASLRRPALVAGGVAVVAAVAAVVLLIVSGHGGQHQAGPAPTRTAGSPGSASSTATTVDRAVASSTKTHPIEAPRRLDGGVFTWSNGVRMSLQIVRNQRWAAECPGHLEARRWFEDDLIDVGDSLSEIAVFDGVINTR